VSSTQHELGSDTVIVRLGGEIGIKAAWTRKLYERRLIGNIKAVLKHYAIPYECVNRRFGRLYLKTSKAQDASTRLARVFGISSVSPALETTSRLGNIVDKSVQMGGFKLKKGSSFAVRCRRVGKHAYTSQDVCREVGRRVLDAHSNLGLRVDLSRPDITLNVEVREDKAYIFTEWMQGVGGLPLGTQPRVVCLLDGSIRSLVACWMVMKRGCPILPLHFDETPFSSETTTRTLNGAKTLFEWTIGFPRKVYIVSHGPNLAQIEQNCPKKLRRILSKRVMYRIAQRVAEVKNAEGIVTGEFLNKPAGKVLHFLSLQEEAVEHFPIHRPLVGLDVSEIEGLAQKIGGQDVESQKTEINEAASKRYFSVSAEEVYRAEKKLNIDELVAVSIETIKSISL